MSPTDVGGEVFVITEGIRREMHLLEPPADASTLLAAHQLSLPHDSLETVLRDLGLAQETIQKLDAMLHIGDRCVFVRSGMHDRKKNWGYMHELGHYVIPWHRDLLYYCAIQQLPIKTQVQLEREADEFASNMFFFGSKFVEEAMSRPFGLQAPLDLVDRYDVSLHAAFWRYAEQNPDRCCLIISEPELSSDGFSSDLRLKYYVKSQGFKTHIPPGQLSSSSSALGRLFNDHKLITCTEHELALGDGTRTTVYKASSMYNQYKVFTLIWSPRTA